jgi:ribonuclease P protein component
MTVQRHCFAPARRLHQKLQFDAVYRRNSSTQRSADNFFAVLARVNDFDSARLGLSVPSRIVPTAVGRNRIKRLVRESFRMNHQLPKVDIVVNARTAALHADNKSIRASLEQHWRTLKEKCARY